MMDIGVSRRTAIVAVLILTLIYSIKLIPRDGLIERLPSYYTGTQQGWSPSEVEKAPAQKTAPADINTNASPASQPPVAKTPYGQIKDRVAVITDTQYTSRHIPLILHFHGVLGPDWPIVFYTSEETIATHLAADAPGVSAVWQRAVREGRVQVRPIPPQFNLTDRHGVNVYLSRPWLWEQLAPATHVLIFQADTILCANGHRTVEDFLEWDWIAATLHTTQHLYNGGLSLRNRSMILDILRDGNSWEKEVASGEWNMGGEDVWFTRKMDLRGAHLPDQKIAVQFAVQHDWHVAIEKYPLGYHKVHKNMPSRLAEITEWCPEIALTAPGTLAAHVNGQE